MNVDAQAARQRPIPLWRWGVWWVAFGAGIVLFYVLLTPVWIGLRALAWIAEFRARRKHD